MAATILCVDADRQLLQIVEKAFAGEGYRALVAHDGEHALEIVREERPDLVVLDLAIPKRNGFDVLQEIRHLPDPVGQVPVWLTCVGRPSPAHLDRANRLGALGLEAKPIPLERLLARVRENLKPAPPSSGGVARIRRQQLWLEGDLGEVGFPGLLHHLHGLRATGVLMIRSGKKRKAIQLRDGYPVAVKSNLVNECLGNYLVRTGKLPREALQESLARMKKGEGLQGEILVAMNVITDVEISAALREQAREKLFEVFAWTDGRFKLELGRRLRSPNALALDTSPANIVLEGARRRTPLELVERVLARNAGRYVRRSQSPFYRFQEVDLCPEEQELLAGLDGSRTLGEVVPHDERMRRTLYGLLAAELLELCGEISHDRTPASPPRNRDEASLATTADEERRLRTELAAMAQQLRASNYFGMLGVSESTSALAIESAYEKRVERVHPDRFAGFSSAVRQLADEVFGLLSRAHATLLDPKARKLYLAGRKQQKKSAADRVRASRAVEAEMEFQQGETLLRQRDYARSLAHFGKAHEAAPEEGEYLAHYAWCLHLCHPEDDSMLQEALCHLKRAVKLARDHEKPYFFLGRLLKVAGDAQAAESMFTRAVQIRPDYVDAIRELRLADARPEKGRGLLARLFGL
jgi:CheY-like chemotaxis protein